MTSQVKIDPLVSGPNLIDNVEVKNKLFESFPDAEGGEMEERVFCPLSGPF